MLAILGIILIVAGAILAFAVERSADGVDLAMIGWIIMAGGALALLVAAIQGLGWMSLGTRKVHTERHVSADGSHYVEDTRAG